MGKWKFWVNLLLQQLPQTYLQNGESWRENIFFSIFRDHSKNDYHLRDSIEIERKLILID